MKDLSDNSIDCFICDLPYGQLVGTNKSKISIGGCAWDVKIDLSAFWGQVKRLAKNKHTPVLMFCNTRFGNDLINSNPSWFRYDLVWDKGLGVSFLWANRMPMKSHEMIYVFSEAGAFYRRIDVKTNKGEWKTDSSVTKPLFKQAKDQALHRVPNSGGIDGMRCPLSVISVRGKKAGGHPTEKPEELYEWLLKRYVPENGTVLDPTAGSFNSCFVADRLGLTAIGIEKDNGFFEKAVKRLNPQIDENSL